MQCRPLKGTVIKLCSLNIHNTISEIPKMSQEGQLKCSHYNSGYCKFAKKERGCRLFHLEATCELPNCRNKKCPDRHPRSCKFGDTCIFQIRCSYKHAKEKVAEKSTSIEDMVKEVDQLKVDIEKLKEENDIKVNLLAKVHYTELEELRTINATLNKDITQNLKQYETNLQLKDS